jgi:hypothetical protein
MVPSNIPLSESTVMERMFTFSSLEITLVTSLIKPTLSVPTIFRPAKKGYLLLTGPSCLDHPVAMVGKQLQGIWAGSSVDFYPFIDVTKPNTSSPGMGLQHLAKM